MTVSSSAGPQDTAPAPFHRMARERFCAFTVWGWDPEMHEQFVIGSCWSTPDERILAAVLHHREHRNFWLAAIGRDASGRYRGFSHAGPYPTARLAEDILSDVRSDELARSEPDFPGLPVRPEGVDLFRSLGDEAKLHPAFRMLRDGPNQSAARAMLTEIARWVPDLDGNLVLDFQTTGYSARTWEFYLYAAMRALGFGIGYTHAVPNLCIEKGKHKVFIEAVTANGADPMTSAMAPGAPEGPPKDFWRVVEEELPLKFGSPLHSKMKKRYWEAPHVAGNPFVLAIADFHAPGSMVWSHTAVPIYLYGIGASVTTDVDGRRSAVEKTISQWRAGTKTVTAPFFWQPDTQHVSAVLFSNAGTISKFNRMGVRAGFGDRFVSLVRRGGWNDHSPGALDAVAFDLDIEHPDYEEHWADELCMYHNPNASLPVDEALFPGITHYRIVAGEGLWRGPAPRVLFSSTTTVDFIDRKSRAELKAAGKPDTILGKDGR